MKITKHDVISNIWATIRFGIEVFLGFRVAYLANQYDTFYGFLILIMIVINLELIYFGIMEKIRKENHKEAIGWITPNRNKISKFINDFLVKLAGMK
jgi:hypothetical protein